MLTLNDGRNELWQWDTGRTLSVDADCSQVHFSNKVFGRSIDVDVIDGTAIIPDVLLQTDKDLNVWAFVGTAENGYTKISKTFKVNRRNKPADYVFTPPEQTTLAELVGRLDKIEESQDPDAIKNAVEDYLEQNPKVNLPKDENGESQNGTNGQLLQTNGDGTTQWVDKPEGSGTGTSSGLNDTAKTLLITILQNGVFTSDQSANIAALEAALASGGNSGGDSGGDSGESVSASYSNGNLTLDGAAAVYNSAALYLSGVSAAYNNGVLTLT